MNKTEEDEENPIFSNLSNSPENYFQNILREEDFEGLKRLVEDSNGIISWEKLIEKWVVRIEWEKIEWIYWKGILEIRWTRLKTLWKLKKVSWWLECNGVETLEDIWELEEVWWNLNLIWTKIKSLWGLKKIEWGLNCEGVKTLKDLWELEEVLWWLSLRWTKIKSLWKLKKIWQHLNCYGLETLEDIWELEEVKDWLDLRWTRIKTLWKLKKVGWWLYCTGIDTLEDLWELEEVLWNLYLDWTRIKSLWKLKKVSRWLYCERVKTLEDLWELEEIWWDLDIRWCNIKIQLEAVKRVRDGKLKVAKLKYDEYIDKIYEWWKLKHEEFEGVFGDNIKKIEDEFMRRQVIWILKRLYRNKKEEIKRKFEKLKKENAGKDLTEEEKREIKDKIKWWDRNLKEIREKIDKFGVKL